MTTDAASAVAPARHPARAEGRPALLGRIAEAVYWAGRYLERAEGLARLVQAHGHAHMDLPVGADAGWVPLLAITDGQAAYADRHSLLLSGRGHDAGAAPEEEVVAFVCGDPDYPSSVLASLAAARSNVRTARAVLPREAWTEINDLWRQAGDDREAIRRRDGRGRWLQRVVDGCGRINGGLWAAMPRDDVMAFFRAGQHVERADLTARVLDVRAEDVVAGAADGPYADVHRATVLRALAAYQPFRRTAGAAADRGAVARFLLRDDQFPRSVQACLGEVRRLAAGLPRGAVLAGACADALAALGDADARVGAVPTLRQAVASVRAAVETVHQVVVDTYFPGVAAAVAAGVAATAPAGPLTTVAPGGGWSGAPAGEVERMRRYQVVHTTTYQYRGTATRSVNEAHLRPRDTGHQRCLASALAVDPAPNVQSAHVDGFGNQVTTFAVEGAFDRLVVTAGSLVEVFPTAPPARTPPWETARQLLDADRQPGARDARRLRAGSRLVPAHAALAAYAAESFTQHRPLLDAVLDLTTRIHRDLAYEPGFTSVTTPVLEVLEHRRGVCQDFAHLAIGCVRSMGLAARYVSGYIETVPPPGSQRMVGADASHAWFSVFVPGWGWFDLDPTNNQVVSLSHVTVAWGRDYADVSPLRGTVEGGGDSHELHVAVEVARLP